MIDLDYQVLKKQYESFIGSPKFERRKAQLRFAQIARNVLISLVKKDKISNGDLSALINLFAYRSKGQTFSRHLRTLGFPDKLKRSIYEEYRKTGETGITGIGLAAIKGLNKNQLRAVKALLKAVSEADSVEKVKRAVDAYEKQDVPKVTRGIYSPWLYYLQPGICPLLTGKVMESFSKWGLEGKLSYGEIVDLFGNIKEAVSEDDLGLIDIFIREVAKPIKDTVTDTPSLNLTSALAKIKRQIILYGPPGTGKTYLTKRLAVELVRGQRTGVHGWEQP